ncbi:WecB UDP-N-acetylglucosamine 2-epimerase [Paracoccaceae bacterium]
MKILTILGARPQFIKAASISRHVGNNSDLTEVLVHTGQHYDADMSDVFFEELSIPRPAHHLGISGGGHGAMTGRMLEALEAVIVAEKPAVVLVYGDTNSTLAGALAAAKLHVPIAHVEAGLRSFNRQMPEEINRVLVDHCADLLFTPTDVATLHLIREGIDRDRIQQVGDVMYDTALYFGDRARALGKGASAFGLADRGFVLATVHRQENTDDRARLASILSALSAAAAQIPVILPLHPRTRSRIADFGLEASLARIKVVDPLGYLDMVGLEAAAAVIATDSGGVQKEAYFHGVPCVTLRDETEWVELVDAGWNRLVSPSSADIAEQILRAVGTQGRLIAPYGTGNAAEKIASALCERFAG